MGRAVGVSQGHKLSDYIKLNDSKKAKRKKKKRKEGAWGQFSLEKENPLIRYNR